MDKQTQENLLNLVKRNYDEISVDFNAARKKYLWPELIKLAEPVKDGDKILDAGCGSGRLMEAFKNKKINYLGVDNSKKLIEAARENFQTVIASGRPARFASEALRARRERSNLAYSEFNQRLPRRPEYGSPRNDKRFEVGDILELDKLPEKDFDYIFCIAVLHHLPGADLRLKALEQMKSKLKPHGKIILTVWNLWSQLKFRKLILKYGLLKMIGKNKMNFGDILFGWKNNRGEKISQRYYHASTKNELKKSAIHAGFKIEKAYQDKYNYYLILTPHL